MNWVKEHDREKTHEDEDYTGDIVGQLSYGTYGVVRVSIVG